MKKHFIFSNVLVLVMLFALSVYASAAIGDAKIILDEDFTRPESEVANPDWKPEGWDLTPTRGEIERVHEDGYVELKQNGTSGNAEVIYRVNESIPSEFTLMYDVCWENYGGRLGYQTSFLNGYTLSINSAGTVTTADGAIASGAPAFDKWCTYVIQVKDGVGTYFRKMEDELTYTKIAENVKLAPTTTSYFRVYVYDGNAGGKKQVSAKVDNVKIYAGNVLTDSAITVSDDKTMITGMLKLDSASVAPDSMMKTTVLMTAYDKKGKFMNIVTNSDNFLKYGEDNTIFVEMPITPEFYDSIKGGTVELYLWDSMDGIRPLCDIVVLEIQ